MFPVPELKRPTAPPSQAQPPRPLRPRTPDDCPACRHVADPSSPTVAAPVQPWHKRKRRRGRRKMINTEGYACPNPECDYHNITDANVQALGISHTLNTAFVERVNLLNAALKEYAPARVVELVDPVRYATRLNALGYPAPAAGAQAYMCVGQMCLPPVTEPRQIAEAIAPVRTQTAPPP